MVVSVLNISIYTRKRMQLAKPGYSFFSTANSTTLSVNLLILRSASKPHWYQLIEYTQLAMVMISSFQISLLVSQTEGLNAVEIRLFTGKGSN